MSRLTASQALTPWDVAALRYGGSFLAVLPLLAWRGLPRMAPRRLPVVLGCAGFGFPLFAYAGYQLAPAAHGAVVMAAGLPVAVALIGRAVWRLRIGRWQALSLGAVVAGSLLLGLVTSGVYAGAWRGDLLFLAGAVSWSVYTLLVQRWRLQALDATLLIGLGAAPLYLPVWWLALPSRMAEAPWPVVLTQGLFHGLGASVVAMLLYTRAVATIGPGPTTMIGAVVPALAALIAWPLLGEALPPLGLLAVAVVSAGMLLGVLKRD
jgi:drug/metabolite transporter (DMT)-like permease